MVGGFKGAGLGSRALGWVQEPWVGSPVNFLLTRNFFQQSHLNVKCTMKIEDVTVRRDGKLSPDGKIVECEKYKVFFFRFHFDSEIKKRKILTPK